MKFFLNHSTLPRSRVLERVDKIPCQLLTVEAHPHNSRCWLFVRCNHSAAMPAQVKRPAATPSSRSTYPEFLREAWPRLCYPKTAFFEPRPIVRQNRGWSPATPNEQLSVSTSSIPPKQNFVKDAALVETIRMRVADMLAEIIKMDKPSQPAKH